jgi:hypothetical protein
MLLKDHRYINSHSERLHWRWIAVVLFAYSFGANLNAQALAQNQDNEVDSSNAFASEPRIQVYDLSPRASIREAARARQLFAKGHIIRLIGGADQDVYRLLRVRVVDLPADTNQECRHCWWLPERKRGPGERSESPSVIAVRISPTGATHQFVSVAGARKRDDSWHVAFKNWVERERARAAAFGLDILPPELSGAEDPQPPTEAWTELTEVTMTQSDSNNDTTRFTVSVYRLNDIDAAGDWYMILTHPQGQPNFVGCGGFPISCGQVTFQRDVSMTTAPEFILYDHGPSTQVSVTTVSFTLGSALNATGPGVSAMFGESWQQPSVDTKDVSSLSNNTAGWSEIYNWPPNSYSPAPTSSSIFLSHQGALFQVPEGTKSFVLTANVSTIFGREINVGGLGQQPVTNGSIGIQIGLLIEPPEFSVTPTQTTIQPGDSSRANVVASIPGSSNGLSWQVSNIPAWLTVSQTSGSGNAVLTLSVKPDATPGTVGSLNFDTNPAFGAPSVEKNPLILTITVGTPPNPPCDPPLCTSGN